MKEIEIWKFISNKIELGQKVVLLIIANASSGSPGRTGFEMVVAEDGTTIGTIGGGIMEFNILDEVKIFFAKEKTSSFYKTLHHSNTDKGNKSGLICGGFQTVLFKFIDNSDSEIVKTILTNLIDGNNGLLQIEKEKLIFDLSKTISEDILFSSSNDNWVLKINIGLPNRVYIVGGGHVGLAVSQIMSSLNFHITVLDHRKNIATILKNKYADKIITTPYNEISSYIVEGNKTYVVIVSPNHDGDKDALQSVLNLNLKYLGSMGSKRKIKSIFNHLLNDGFTEKDLEKIHTPIGIEIKAETPEEIAISIAAEIIKEKNKLNA
jgi:xanthine dehydrogenase accessory factor